jgi:2-methylisocitrate lyase-like PEP mutase family enzyme
VKEAKELTITPRRSWRDVLEQETKELPLLLPAAHDALTARLIERAGFPAYQIGGFALVGAMHANPDIDLEHFGEKRAAARNIIDASRLPVLVDGDDGYGDVKNVTRTVLEYERMGASALFIEDQQAPKECGHMDNKRVVPAEEMEKKVRAAVATKNNLFLLARTDARQPLGLDEALRRGDRYLKAGADGVYIEGPENVEELERVGKAFSGVPLATSILERGGKTPWVAPRDLRRMGFTMILYPTTILFRVSHAIEQALNDLAGEQPLSPDNSVNMPGFEQIVNMPFWQEIEKKFAGKKQG